MDNFWNMGKLLNLILQFSDVCITGKNTSQGCYKEVVMRMH